MYDRFNDDAQRALTRAKAEAGARDSDEITLVHILAGLVHSDSETSNLLAASGVDGDAVQRILRVPRVDPTNLEPGAIPFSDASKIWLKECVREAVTEAGLEAITSRHLLAALAKSDADEITAPLSSAGIVLPVPDRP